MPPVPRVVLTPLVAAALLRFAETYARAACGDGVLDPDESCDLGIGNEVGTACTTRCSPPSCGDGHVDVGEACDDGNGLGGDGCSPTCVDESTPVWATTVELGDEEATDGEAFAAVARTSAGYVAVGSYWRETADSPGIPDFGPFVVGFDSTGTRQWLDVPAPASGLAYAGSVVVRGDDDLWVAGAIPDAGGDLRPTLWRYTIEGALVDTLDLTELDGTATINTLVADAEGRVFLGGAHAAPGIPETGWIGEVDLDAGALSWWIDTAERRRVADLAPMHDGRIAAAGWRANCLWAGVVDDAGVAQWTQELPNEDLVQERLANAVAVADDDTIYVAGRVSTYVTNDSVDLDGWLGAFSPDGTPLWTRNVSGAGLVEDFADVVVVDGVPVAIGQVGTAPLVGSGTGDVDIWVQAFDVEGAATWQWMFDAAMHHIDSGNAAILEPDGGLTVVGSTTEPLRHFDAWIARMRPNPAPRMASVRGTVRASDRSAPAPILRATGPSATTLVLDFDGGTLRAGDRGDLGELPCFAGEAPYPGLVVDAAQAQAIADRVAMVMDPYGVRVRWGEPLPAHLPRTTVLLGGEPTQLGLDPSATGYSCVVDCGNAWPWDLALAFAGPAASVANTAAHEAGHTWGLDHVVDMSQLMYPLGATPLADWGDDACVAVSEQTSAVLCGDTHRTWCDDGQQNSRAELLAALGPKQPDVSAPVVSLVLDAEALAPGEPARLEVSYDDDAGVPGLRLVVPELGWERVVTGGETSFTLPLPVGRYTILAEAIDHAENTATAMAEVVVGEPDPAADTGSSGSGSDATEAADTGSSAGPSEADSGDGCACRSSAARPGGLTGGFLVGFGGAVVRRRLRRRAFAQPISR